MTDPRRVTWNDSDDEADEVIIFPTVIIPTTDADEESIGSQDSPRSQEEEEPDSTDRSFIVADDFDDIGVSDEDLQWVFHENIVLDLNGSFFWTSDILDLTVHGEREWGMPRWLVWEMITNFRLRRSPVLNPSDIQMQPPRRRRRLN